MGVRGDIRATIAKDQYVAAFEEIKQATPVYPDVYNVVKGAEGAGEKETQLLNVDALEEKTAENPKINFVSPQQGWAFYCKYRTFWKGITMSDEEVTDNMKLKDAMVAFVRTLTKRDIQLRETIAADPFNHGGDLLGHAVFNGSHTNESAPYGNKMYDNGIFFALSGNEYTHKSGGKYYNSVASLTLSADNFTTLYNLMATTNAYDETDIAIQDYPNTLLCRDGADFQEAKRILESDLMPGSQRNDVNVLKGLCKPLGWRYIASTAGFFVGKAKDPRMEFRERQQPQIRYFRSETDLSHNSSYMMRIGIWIKGRPWVRGGGTSA